MTAHAMKGDRERCLAAGMDGYVSKPIQAESSSSIVEGQAPPNDFAGGPPTAGPGEGEPLDAEALLRSVDGNRGCCARSPSCSSTTAPGPWRGSARPSRPATPGRWIKAHAFRGSVGVLFARPALEAVTALERIGRDGDLDARRAGLRGARARALAARPGPGLADRGGHAVRILVVEDDLIVRRVLRGHLESCGHEVTQALDGSEAWELFSRDTSPSSSATG